ncbi:MAG: peptidoglycan-associated lipoprotein Pal [Deltaproteobacteria bacterium]|nr:peptidoglycan-associated lipoprotein Pal [Deltaproteobacteria bacterium]
MQRKLWMVLALLLLVPGLMLLTSCAQKSAVDQDTTQKTTPPADTGSTTGSDDLQADAAKRAAEQAMNQFINEHIYFNFDSAALSAMAQATLKNKAAWLKANPSAMVVIEGNCDNRGTNEYNLALGERRALSAQAYLVDLGISASRISTISYGEERPLDNRNTEEAWAKNRNDQFKLR